MKSIVNELETLHPLLSNLRDLTITNPEMVAVQVFGNKYGALDQYQTALEELVKVLKKSLDSKGLQRRLETLLWPLREGETLKYLTQIERIKQTFIIALSLDSASSSKKNTAIFEED
ncbi:hypothetical protein Q9L58_007919 [Maublancomyces gigas]|uniref:Uncharacterized protein n=1 Tax=Discina gigas TaxID=1032678 RepID=A0ABR3GB38_9PEZI